MVSGRYRLHYFFALFILLAVSYSAVFGWSISKGRIGGENPDIWLRLHAVETLHQTHDWYNHTITRDNAPFGLISHWTRSVDLLLWLPAETLSIVMPFRTALLVWATLYSGVLLCLLFLALHHIANSLNFGKAGHYATAYGILLFAASQQPFTPTNVDYHNLLLLCAVGSLAFIIRAYRPPNTYRAPFIAGLISGFAVWTSPEFNLHCALLLAWMGWRWLMGDEKIAPVLRGYSSGLFAVVFIGFLLEQRPSDWLLIEYDSLSIVYLCLYGLIAFFAWIASYAVQWKIAQKLGFTFVSVILTTAVMFYCFPLFYLGAYGNVSPYMQEHFLSTVIELQPLYMWHGWLGAITLSLPHAIAIVIALFLLFRRMGSPLWWLLILITTAYMLLPFWHQRWMNYSVIALPLLALGIDHLYTIRPVYAKAAFSLAVYTTLAFLVLSLQGSHSAPSSHCQQKLNIAIREGELQKHFGSDPITIASHGNFGAHILFWSPHRVISSNYHRNEDGYRDMLSILNAQDNEQALSIIRRRQIDAIMLCKPLENTLPPVEPNSLWGRLAEGKIPNWLEPVESFPAQKDGALVYKVIPTN